MNDIMETQDNFEQYFMTTFKQSFSELLQFCLKIVSKELKEKLQKLYELKDSLNYKKIIIDFSENKNFQLWMIDYKKSNFIDNSILKKGDKKQWRIMPSFQIDDIMRCIEGEHKLIVYKHCKKIYSCSEAYSKVIEQNELVPSIKDEHTSIDFGIDEIIGDNKYNEEKPDSCEFLLETILSKWDNSDGSIKTTLNKLSDNIDSLDEEKIMEASTNMQNSLKSDDETKSSKFLSSLINTIGHELKDLKNNEKNLKGKKGFKKIHSIVGNIQEKLKDNLGNDEIDGLELWRTATSFVKKTTGSDNVDIIHNYVESIIVEKMNQNTEELIRQETEDYINNLR
jgi:hypothetical protein